MSSQTSRKIIVASVMAAVVGIGVVTFALRSHPMISVAKTPQPLNPVTQTPAADLRAAEIPAAPPPTAETPPAAVAQTPDAPAALTHHDGVGANSTDTATPPAVGRKLGHKQHLAKADTSAVTTDGTVTRTAPTPDTSDKPAAQTAANGIDRVKSADELKTPTASSSPADDQKAGTSTEFTPSDSEVPPK